MIDETVKARMREITERYPSKRSGMLPCLHLAQEVEGYVTPEGILAVAEVTETKPDEVESVVTFYSMYRQHPAGKHTLKVCTSISCYLLGCDDLLTHLEARLGVARGETTPDGRFTLQGVECLAACGMAPVLQVNDAFVENVTPAVADALLARLGRGEEVSLGAGNWNVMGGAARVTEPAGRQANADARTAATGE